MDRTDRARRRCRIDQGADKMARGAFADRRRTRGLAGAGVAPRRVACRVEAERGLDGFVVPRADEHQGEYVPRRSQRLGWLTGFGGSAGLAIVLADQRCDLRRRTLHPRRPRPGRHQCLRAASDPRAGARRLDRRQPAEGRQAGLRPVAADGRRLRAFRPRCRARRRQFRAGRVQSGRRRVAWPSRCAAGARAAAPGGVLGRNRARRDASASPRS